MTHDSPIISTGFEKSCGTTSKIKHRFTLHELSGSLGDLGTFFPIALAVSIACRMDIAMIFVCAGLMNIVTGLYFRQPIPVQPMKAIAAVSIAENLTSGEVAAAGFLMGILLVVLCLFGVVDFVAHKIPKSIVRGIQLGIGIKLAIIGAMWLRPLPVMGFDSMLLSVLTVCVLLGVYSKTIPTLIAVFAIGILLAFVQHGAVMPEYHFALPNISLSLPNANEWWVGFSKGTLPQLPLTLLNSVIAICFLAKDYFPNQTIAPKRMAMSVGLMNLVSVPLGGIPMCHGSGGLAAQYRFGARSGGSVIMLGTLKIIAALALGSYLIFIVQHFPTAILSVTLIFAGITLASATKDSLRGIPSVIVLTMGVMIVFSNTVTGLIAGVFVYFLLKRFVTQQNTDYAETS